MSEQAAVKNKPKKNKQSVIFTKSLEVVAKRRAADNESGERVDETVYIQLNRMSDLRNLRSSFVKPQDAAVSQLMEIPHYPINDQLFLYLAEQMKLAQVVDLPDKVEETPEIENSEEETETPEIEEYEEEPGDDD